MGLVVGEQGAGRPCQLAHPGVEALVRKHQPVVVRHRGLGHHDGDVAAIQRCLERRQVVEGHQHRVLGHVGRQAVLLGHERTRVVQLDERLVEVPVVLAVEHQHLVSAGHHARDPDHLGVGLRRGQRVLPLGEAVAARELLGHDDRVLGRQQELVAARHAVAHRPHDRLGRVAAEHRHVGDVEVAVREPVDVGEPGPLPGVHPDRQVVIGAAEPGHRHAVGHRVPGARPQLGRPGASRVEPLVLGVLELLDQVAVDRRGEHGGQSRRGGQGQNRTADTAVFSRVLYQLSYLAGWCRLESFDPSAPDGLRSRDLRLDRAVRTAGLLYRRVCVVPTPVRRGAGDAVPPTGFEPVLPP